MLMIFFGCGGMATLFHGSEPEEKKPTYTLLFDANGATGTVPKGLTVNEGTTIILPSEGNLGFSGKVFTGWCVSPGGLGATYAVGYSFSVTSNQTLYARWVNQGDIQQYAVSFNANGATGGIPPATQTVYSGLNITVPNQGGLTNTGKNFTGWNTAIDGSGTNYFANDVLTVIGNLTLYAQWINPNIKTYTVAYNANGASGTVPSGQKVNEGTAIIVAGIGSLTYSGRTFNGWNTAAAGTGTSYAAGSTLPVYTNITLYAQWSLTLPDDLSLEQSLVWINNNAINGGIYTILLRQNESTYGMNLNYSGKIVDITVRGLGEERTVTLGSDTNLLTVGRNVTLTLDEKVTLKGRNTNTSSRLIEVQGGTLVMNDGSKVIDNAGGGIHVAASTGTVVAGSFTMNGGEISGHNISGSEERGGGVRITNGIFNMHGGKIMNNSCTYGAGVALYATSDNSSFIMDGGTISNNSGSLGGGVHVSNPNISPKPIFTLSGTAVIENNTANTGGGVYVNACVFNMNGGIIKKNISGSGGGGGVYNSPNGEFYMNNGEISGNSTTLGNVDVHGGGVYSKGKFIKSGSGNAVIYGSNADTDLANITRNNSGHAVNSWPKVRNTTARSFDVLDSSISGAEGGWE
jgi:hypothetical protein